MAYCIAKPSFFLSRYVKHYWTLENCLPINSEHIQRIVPNGMSELIFYFGTQPESNDKSKPTDETSILTGQLKEYYDIKVKGRLSIFSIIFLPYGLSTFFNIPASEFYNQNVPLKFLQKNLTDELEGKLYEASSFLQRINIVENFLYDLLCKNKEKPHFKRIEHSVQQITKTKGIIGIEELASEACLSRKQFERTFLDFVGASPKKFLKIIRFQNTIYEKAKNQEANLSQLSYQCGYYDQSHMTNEFVKLSGMTPKEYFRDCEPFSDYFQ